MSNITYLIIGIVVGYIIGKSFGRAQDKLGQGKGSFDKAPSTELRTSQDKSGLIKEQAEEKKRHLEKVVEYINGKHPSTSSGQVDFTNDQIQQLLGVSDATAERYLQEMEVWGKIRQVGRTGKQVTYEKI